MASPHAASPQHDETDIRNIALDNGSLIELLMPEKKKEEVRFSLYGNSVQKWLLGISLGLMLAALVLGFLRWVPCLSKVWLRFFALLYLFISSICTVIYQMLALFSIAQEAGRQMKSPERAASTSLLTSFEGNVKLVQQIVAQYDISVIELAKDRFALLANQLRDRFALIFGKVEVVGMIPLLLSGGVAFHKLAADYSDSEPNGSSWVSWALQHAEWWVIPITIFCFITLKARSTGHWMDERVVLLSHAAKLASRKAGIKEEKG